MRRRLIVGLLILLGAGLIVRAEDRLVPLNVARGKPAKASATQEGHSAAEAVDGDLGTRWCAPDNNAGYWWEVDLQKAQDFTNCRIVWEHEGASYQYKIEGSADEKTWSMLADATASKSVAQVHEHKFDAKGIRYVRLSITGTAPGHWASFLEFELFGKETIAASKQTIKSGPEGGAPSASNLSVSGEGLLREVKVAPEFNATIFAAPPDVSYPTCITAAPTGELFVGIDENGSLDQKPGRGRIVRCIDSDGDGKADKFNVFADDIDSPRGLQWDGGGTLYVLHPPLLEAIHDDNGDGVADRREIIVKGIGPDLKFRGADHTINGIRQGIDGWIYVACGDYGFMKAVTSKGKELQLRGGGVVRVRPDGSDIEDVSHGQRNIYDVAISPTMDLFTRDNTNDGGGWDVRLSHVIQSGNYGYPSLFKNFGDEIIQPIADSGGGSPCGSLFVDEPGLPDGYGNALYTCEWGRSAVNRHPISPNGATYKIEQQSFVEVPRPTDIDIDGQGKIYVSSWHNGGFNYGGPNVGYVLQVFAKDSKPAPFPDLKKASDDDLLKDLASASGVCRFFTQQEILRRGEKPNFTTGLLKLAAADGPVAARVAALFTLSQLQHAGSHEAILKLAADPKMREFALRAAADQRLDAKDLPSKPYLDALSDSNPRVRLQGAIAFGRLNRVEAGSALLKLTADEDPIVAHAAVQAAVAVRAIDPSLKAIDDSNTALVPGAMRILQLIQEPAVTDGLMARLEKVKEPAVRIPMLKALCRLHNREADWTGDWWGTRPDTSGPYFRAAAWSETPKIAAALRAAVASADDPTARALLIEIQKDKLDLGNSTQMLLKLAAGDEKFAESAVDLVAGKNDISADMLPLLERMAVSTKQPPGRRANALRALARAAAAKEEHLDPSMRAFAAVTMEDKPADEIVRAREEYVRDGSRVRDEAAFVKLAASDQPGMRELGDEILLTIEQKADAPKQSRDAAARAIDAAWSDPTSAATLLRAIGQCRADAYAHQVRSHLNDPDAAIKSAAVNAAGELRLDAAGPKKITVSQIPYEQAVAEAVKTKGDPKLGAQLFVRQGCVACHTTSANDPPKGPFLGDAASKYSRPELLESILHPSAKIAQGFVTNYFITTDGKRTDGFIVKEAGDEIEVRTVQGVSTIVPRNKIKKRGELKDSVMPTGLADPLSTEELASILAYLESLKAK